MIDLVMGNIQSLPSKCCFTVNESILETLVQSRPAILSRKLDDRDAGGAGPAGGNVAGGVTSRVSSGTLLARANEVME